ncbi:MAG: hypothetical protein NTU73_07255 [Ignavibacteriae bacterium]|nr:hypothetical protein [Ignavibacteriota bacterium]
MQEEEQHIDIREKLLNLPKAKASDDFVNALQRKINLAEGELSQKKITDEVKETIWVKLFGKKRNPWLIPSLSLTIVTIFIISVYLYNFEKKSIIPVLTDTERKITTSEDSKLKEKSNEELNENAPLPDEMVDLMIKNTKSDLRSPSETGKGYTEQAPMEQVTPSVERESGRTSEPTKIDDAKKEETGKSEFKKEEKINQNFDNSIREEKVMPKEGNLNADETKQKVKADEKTESKDNIESKGLIDKKEKMTMKKSAKSSTDSTRIDKKVLEKIKEEIEKTVEEKK